MVVFVGTPQFRRIASWVAMGTMRCSVARLSFFLGTNPLGMPGVPMNNLTPMESCPGVAS